jgi:hypothetical protein
LHTVATVGELADALHEAALKEYPESGYAKGENAASGLVR